MRSLRLVLVVAVASCGDPQVHFSRPDPADDATVTDASIDAPPVTCSSDLECQAPPNPCLLAGTCDLSRGVCDFSAVDCSGMTDECNTGVCDLTTGACVQAAAHEDAVCGAGVVCGVYSACDFTDFCDSSAVQSRTCTRHACRAGTCAPETYMETAACSRVTEGSTCMAPTTTGCGPCGYADVCDESATASCTCTAHTCKADLCTPTATTCLQACSRDTDGITCGSGSVEDCGPCTYPEACAEEGAQSCTCTSFACGAGVCNPASSSCSQSGSCSRVTDGMECGSQTCIMDKERPLCCTAAGACTQVCGICI